MVCTLRFKFVKYRFLFHSLPSTLTPHWKYAFASLKVPSYLCQQCPLQVQVLDVSSGVAVSEVFGVDFSVKMSKRFVCVAQVQAAASVARIINACSMACLTSSARSYMTQSEDVFLHSGIEGSDCDIVLLTWQKQRPHAIFLPNSSYPQGRCTIDASFVWPNAE
jgi:hypothetical protein